MLVNQHVTGCFLDGWGGHYGEKSKWMCLGADQADQSAKEGKAGGARGALVMCTPCLVGAALWTSNHGADCVSTFVTCCVLCVDMIGLDDMGERTCNGFGKGGLDEVLLPGTKGCGQPNSRIGQAGSRGVNSWLGGIL